MPDVEDDITPPEQPVKITILLPLDTVEKIDQMAKIARLGSRGRTIQALVDTLATSQLEMNSILNVLNAVMKTSGKISNAESVAYNAVVLLSASNLVHRFNKFLDLKPVEAATPRSQGV